MFGNLPVLDLAISLILIFLLLSVIASGIAESIQMKLKTRSKLLYNSLEKIFSDSNNKNWADMIYRHPLVNSMKKDETSLPSYLPSEIFANTLIDIIIREGYDYRRNSEDPDRIDIIPTSGTLIEKFKKGVKSLQPSDVRILLFSFLETSERQLSANEAETNDSLLSKSIQIWYDSYMERIAGWYKRKTQKWLLAIGLSIAVIFNIDTLTLINHFLSDKAARNTAVEIAIKKVESGEPIGSFQQSSIPENASMDQSRQLYEQHVKNQMEAVDKAKADLLGMNLPIGWKTRNDVKALKFDSIRKLHEKTKILLDSIPAIVAKQCSDSLTHQKEKTLNEFLTKYGLDLCTIEQNAEIKLKYDSLVKKQDEMLKCPLQDCQERSATEKNRLAASLNLLKIQYDEGLANKIGFGTLIGGQFNFSWGKFFMTLFGWLITGFAISRGSTFWFENLSRLVNLRNAGTKPSSTTQK